MAKGMPLLMAVTKPMAGPKVPIYQRPKHVIVSGLVSPDKVIIYGTKGWGHSQVIATITSNGLHPLYPDDYIGCDEVWAQKTGLTSVRVYAWIE